MFCVLFNLISFLGDVPCRSSPWKSRQGPCLFSKLSDLNHWNGYRSDWLAACADIRLMHSPWSILRHRIVYRRMENPKVVPNCNVTFLDRRHQNVLRLQNSQLDVGKIFADRNHIVDDLDVTVDTGTKEKLPYANAVDMECFLAGSRVDPDKRVLQNEQSAKELISGD